MAGRKPVSSQSMQRSAHRVFLPDEKHEIETEHHDGGSHSADRAFDRKGEEYPGRLAPAHLFAAR